MSATLTTPPRDKSYRDRPGGNRPGGKPDSGKPKVEPKIIHQTFFKSVGPRTYASQVKELGNGNQLLVLTEGKRDDATGEVRKTRLFVYAEDFAAFFKMLQESATFISTHPLPESVRRKRQQFWAKQANEPKSPAPAAAAARGCQT
ncbi:MAG: DUF3276 family protein [Tepidisphaeraceae bacterium]|jgi:hypothetical protein